ncbi:flagellar biosynthesis protein FlgI, partial [Xanthomonas hortorum pv. gardneri]
MNLSSLPFRLLAAAVAVCAIPHPASAERIRGHAQVGGVRRSA